jgi:hypothetical protein
MVALGYVEEWKSKVLFFISALIVSLVLAYFMWYYTYNGYWDLESTIFFFANVFLFMVVFYMIKGIPRFMLFDRDGNILEVSADRPSQGVDKKLLQLEGI